ncbi:M14 family zinc carboxypeptidase [Paraflavitalea speifideaquila]|uniref:M14 family zinc carboxypeptidase n=1 Tax=Paraflavitalea speifideaquila TaxID=3076558 RepID=UPI0028EB0BCE|nr:M14 family zinc carboxypeptidase [Paraflavitalea speifideiaquila]
MKLNIASFIFTCAVSVTGMTLQAQQPNQVFKGAGSPVNPKVPMNWNRYNDHAGISDIVKKIAAAHPDLCKLESIGKSFQGRDLWCLTISDFKKGAM